MKIYIPSTLLLLTANTLAQTATITATTPLTASVQAGGASQSNSLPVGPLPAMNLLRASLVTPAGGTSASLLTAPIAGPSAVGFEVALGCVSRPGGAASIAPGSLQVMLSNPTNATADLRFYSALSGTAGAAIPQLDVDVNDDGSIDYSMQTANSTFQIPISLGPTALPIRVYLGASTTGDASVGAQLQVVATPRATTVLPAISQCAPINYAVIARFDGNLDFDVDSPSQPIGVVFGLSVQPVLLGSMAIGPCIGLPQPDIVLLFFGYSAGTLTIPPAARPLQLWSQAIAPFGPTIGTSAAYAIFAN